MAFARGPKPEPRDRRLRFSTREKSMLTYLTKTVGEMTIVYYKHPRLGDCHVAYYTE